MRRSRSAQRGAVILTAALATLLLLGFIGLALDTGRLFVARSELQTALDGCALAAAAELEGSADALVRARSAGLSAGNLHRVGFQSATWQGSGPLANADITFLDSGYAATTIPASARYAKCAHTLSQMDTWLIRALGAFSGNTTTYSGRIDVTAQAVAGRAIAQTSCPIPVAMRPKTGGTAPNWGYTVGEWVTLLASSADTGQGGYIGWANLNGSSSASDTTAELNGFCDVKVGDTLGTPGVQSTITDNWNWRFGIYKNTQNPSDPNSQPDFTGYAYTTTNWPSGASAYNGATPAGAPAGAANYVTMRTRFANCINSPTVGAQSVNACETLIGRTLNGEQKLLPSGASAVDGHYRWGTTRRLVLVPITRSFPGSVADYACMFMLQPLSIPKADIQLEYLGNASSPGSPCTTSGLAGGTAGPLVPVLVR
jgi:hypothetical protein